MNVSTYWSFFLVLLLFYLTSCKNDVDWPEYHGNGHRDHFSQLNQINHSNVNELAIAWTYHSGGADTMRNRTQIQTNPIIIDGILYGVSADIQAFAINASDGQEIWKTNFDKKSGTTSRGVTYWSDGVDARIFFGTGKWLYALDARTGLPDPNFADEGRIDLIIGVDRPGADEYISSNTPNTIYKNLIITGVRVSESETALLGDIRAFDVITGDLVWTFETIPSEDDPAYQTWDPAQPREHLGGANCWMGMAIDRPRGIVYVPTGSAAFDFYGGNRRGDNLYANCLLALDAETGKKLWHYQMVRHDIWDRDPPAPPNLLTIHRDGMDIDVVAVVTKQGFTFVFDRVTGEPIFPIEEVAFNQDAMPGEYVSKTQPVPVLPKPFTRQSFTEADFNSFVANKDSLIEILSNARTGSPYIPVTEQMTIFFPGTSGGAQWGGAASDPDGILYVPSKENPVYTTLAPKKQLSGGSSSGLDLYSVHCSACHGADRSGNHDGSYPSLLAINDRISVDQLDVVISKGRGRMPSFNHLSRAEKDAIEDFIYNENMDQQVVSTQQLAMPYQNTGYNRWYDAEGYPVNTPPWGTLTAIDLNTGEHKWRVPLGEYEALTAKGIPVTGTDNYGGPLVTSGGLIFIGATRDDKFRAFDKETGELLWEYDLPTGGYATPSTYSIDGKQYVVIACGGGKLLSKSGDTYVAFALRGR